MQPLPRPEAQDRIDVRLPTATKQVIEHASIITGVTLSDFVISRAYEAAAAIVRDHDAWTLNRRDSKAFVASLLDPPEPNEALRAAARRNQGRRGQVPGTARRVREGSGGSSIPA